jgi:hypothetical protein
MPKLGTPVGLDHLEPYLTRLPAPVDEGDRFYSFSFSAAYAHAWRAKLLPGKAWQAALDLG